ncbi:MAG TPA: hypothetical protein DIT89_01360 [Planctomycetaceae bacterium]|nr:hypothetical protein [Planctomycetaceae bacterium]
MSGRQLGDVEFRQQRCIFSQSQYWCVPASFRQLLLLAVHKFNDESGKRDPGPGVDPGPGLGLGMGRHLQVAGVRIVVLQFQKGWDLSSGGGADEYSASGD